MTNRIAGLRRFGHSVREMRLFAGCVFLWLDRVVFSIMLI